MDNSNNDNDNLMLTIEAPSTSHPLLPTALSEIVEYYLRGSHQLTGKKEFSKQLLLLFVALSGAGLYAVAADDYAKAQHGKGLDYRIPYIISTCVPALVILYNSTEAFLTIHASEQVPKILQNYLANPYTKAQKYLQNISLSLGAAISAIPLAAVSIMYPIPNMPKALLTLQTVIVQVDNTVLHFLPIKLAMQNRWYRFPIIPLEIISRQLHSLSLSSAQKDLLRLEKKKNAYYQHIKQLFIGTLNRIQSRVVTQGVFNDRGISRLPHQQNPFSTLFPVPVNFNATLLSILRNNASEGQRLEMLEELANWSYRVCENASAILISAPIKFLRQLSYGVGALWVAASCAGYLVAPINQLSQLTNNLTLGTILSAPSVYFLGVLLAFFGGNAARDTFDYISSWKITDSKWPIEFKLYPSSATLLITISAVLSIFSFAAAAELIEDNFQGKLEFLRPYMLMLAKTGLPFLGFTAMLNFWCLTLKQVALHGGNQDAKMVILLIQTLDHLKTGIQLMKPQQFLASLAVMDVERLHALLSLYQPQDFQELNQTLSKLADLGDDTGEIGHLRQTLNSSHDIAQDVTITDTLTAASSANNVASPASSYSTRSSCCLFNMKANSAGNGQSNSAFSFQDFTA